jgi:hypothetical protein
MSERGTERPHRPVPSRTQLVSGRFAEAVAAIVGERFAESRIDDDDYLHVTVIELTGADEAAILDVARQLDLAGWVRIERADPGALDAWERVRQDLLRLQDADPHVLLEWPTPSPGYRRPPIEIHLTADAADVAEALYQSHGSYVRLIVGALEYPTRQPEYAPSADSAALPVDPREMRVELDGPLAVRSGETVTHGLLLTNLTAEPIVVNTNGQLTADVIDPATGAVVGGYTRSQHRPGVGFQADPSGTVRIPLLVGTASYVADLGYAVPSGVWAVAADLPLQDGRRLRTPSLELTVLA